MEPAEQIERLCNRFQIAVSNFGRSCIDMQANEKAFQAWYASSIIQEFGISHVYREIHLWKKELFFLAPPNRLTAKLEKGNELFPDRYIDGIPIHLTLDRIPAWVCTQCSEAYFDEPEVGTIQEMPGS